ncbi:Glycerophosphoryl diester phosphodiesterase family protein (fragment) [Shewanella benthica]|uniref:Glycerophosphoryl diester phosphodiesterase family protein n=1 Tax=Shewanella benthica TaxID=43661 RepID=A0A330M0E0_9GAMM
MFLDDRYDEAGFDPLSETSWSPSMADLKAQGIGIIAPPLWVLVTLDSEGELIPSEYANDAGLKIITWSLERSGLLIDGGGWTTKVSLLP